MRTTGLRLAEKALVDGFNESDLKTLSMLINEVKRYFGYPSYAKLARDVGVSSRVLLDRAKRPLVAPLLFNYQRTLQGLIRICDEGLGEDEGSLPPSLQSLKAQWIPAPESLREKMQFVSVMLADIVVQLRGRNDGESLEELLDPVGRAQLIAALETSLEILKTPLVEVGLLGKVARWLGSLAKSSVDRGVSVAVGVLAAEGAQELIKLIAELRK